MSSEVTTEVGPSDEPTSLRILVLLPPFSCLILELERSELDIVLWTDIAALEVFVDVNQPVIRVQMLGARTEGLRLVTEELTESGKLWFTTREKASSSAGFYLSSSASLPALLLTIHRNSVLAERHCC